MVTKWSVKELLSAVKMNNFGIRRLTDSEELATLDSERLAGDVIFNSDNKAMHVYQSGTGSTFLLTELSNFLFRNSTQLGIGSSKLTVYDEPFVNTAGRFNRRVFVSVEYLPYVSLAGTVDAVVTDGSSPITVADAFSSNPTPVLIYKTLVVDTTSFTLDDILNIQLAVQNAEIQYVEFRGV